MDKYEPDEFFHYKKPTNADRIRAMTDEQMARWLAFVEWMAIKKQPPITLSEHEMRTDWLEWLRIEV